MGFGWSLYTQHVWEDYYITYRASKNLATGNGLTFTVGERVHSFTSPLGVLLPALSSLLVGNSSDTAALWVFRLFSISAYAGAGVLLWLSARRLFSSAIMAGVLVAAFGLETKIVDYSTNGMESGLVVLFLAWMIHACFTNPPRQITQIGLAWAGLMWSRPDSFIYIGAFGIGLLLFPPGESGWSARKAWLRKLVLAGLITTAVYLPWLIWAQLYYGTPIPHTVTAKGLGGVEHSIGYLMGMVIDLPTTISEQTMMFQTIFMPPYSHNTGWPAWAQNLSYWMSLAGMFVWLMPKVRREIRILSFTYFGGLLYLLTFVGFPTPWYLPTVTTLCIATWALLGAQIIEWIRKKRPDQKPLNSWLGLILGNTVKVMAIGSLIGIGTITVMAAHQLKWQQTIVERGNRELLGRWLAESATSNKETVFLEPLGYIGFYSGLKMLDYPGLSSPEVVEARKLFGANNGVGTWSNLIRKLNPTWLVMRKIEADDIKRMDADLLEKNYQLAKVFDVRDQVHAVKHLVGKGYLLNDSHYEVYRINPEQLATEQSVKRLDFSDLKINEANGGKAHFGGSHFGAHAPSRLVFDIPTGATDFTGAFGIDQQSIEEFTDGGEFIIKFIRADGSFETVLERRIDPMNNAADLDLQEFDLKVDSTTFHRVELIITAGPTNNNARDWTFWRHLKFELNASE